MTQAISFMIPNKRLLLLTGRMPQAASLSLSVSGMSTKRASSLASLLISSSGELLSLLVTLGGTAKKATMLT